MSFYLKVEGISLEEYLKQKGQQIEKRPTWEEIPKDKACIALIENPSFSCGAILTKRDLEDLIEEEDELDDDRPKKFYLLSFDDAERYSNWKRS